MSRFFTLALALYAVQALDDQACIDSIPPQADPATVDSVYKALVDMGANMIVMQATFETCIQESRCNNLNCGDQDSVGAFQQRPVDGLGHRRSGVQRAELGNLYAQRFDWANQLIAEAQARAGGTSPAAAESGPGTQRLHERDRRLRVDSCWAIANAHGIDVGTFLSKNPSVDAGCSNLQVGVAYCV
ncbi:hypothetical protein BKA62DRAFT_719345 [Auriculariales sp. MPI-PUGE-AT-0066]|nr:hypothetical protein BKA62DRAFT_719345 [Auriculariales sp. MPI-PUGE-AT-0066]